MRQVLDAHVADLTVEPVIVEQEGPFYGEEEVRHRAEAAIAKVTPQAVKDFEVIAVRENIYYAASDIRLLTAP